MKESEFITVRRDEYTRLRGQVMFQRFMLTVLSVGFLIVTAMFAPPAYEHEQHRRVETLKLTNR